MAKAFLKSVAEYIYNHHKDTVESLCIVLPNKRASLFLKSHLAQAFNKTFWLPRIMSAEELITEFSNLQTLEEIDLIGHLYESYRVCYGENAEPFDSFAKWGQLILQDFNEIDRYLADSTQLYENLKDIKVIENWSLGEESLSENQLAYLKFMASLGAIYKHFSSFLLSKGWAYQGLAYKQAVKLFSESEMLRKHSKILFCGFNALNAAEQIIFQTLYSQKKAELIWDADTYYLNDQNQEAGFFLRKNFEQFKQRDPQFVESNLGQKKDIKIISVPRQIGQAQLVKQTLQDLIDRNIALDKVAIVLANEKLLWPVLQQLPPSIEHINITMEYPLKYTSTYSFINQLIQLQFNFNKQKRNKKTIYHLELIQILRHPLFLGLLKIKKLSLSPEQVIKELTKRNIAFVGSKQLVELFAENYESLSMYFEECISIQNFCSTLLKTIDELKAWLMWQDSQNKNNLELEYLHVFSRNFKRVSDLLHKYSHFNDINSLKQLFSLVLGNSSAPFLGEPLRGLQIMGVLETRLLDFDHLIIVNANEGILPSGRSSNSFIPNDLKRAFGLPLYADKDAIYAYHFYRLIQKAKEITITYDSETDSFGKGEKSRFVTQLQLELKSKYPEISITEEVASYSNFPKDLENTVIIEKNSDVLSRILRKAHTNDKFGGLSPSGLITYKDCSLKFYYRYGAQLKETKEIEENAEANTFGSILHLSLEQLYQEFIGTTLQAENIKNQINQIDEVVNKSFKTFFDNNTPTGKSVLQQEVIKVYVQKLLTSDVQHINTLISKNQHLSLFALEKEYTASIQINIDGKLTPLFIKGKIDRVDSFGGMLRIIDYKNSIKLSDKFIFSGFEKLFYDVDYNKQLQLFIYSWLLFKNNITEAQKLHVCIIPFKIFENEPKYILGLTKKRFEFNNQFFQDFELELVTFIESIFNKSLPFIQTTEDDIHEYCPYNSICNFKVKSK